jgi:hypothetical protein
MSLQVIAMNKTLDMATYTSLEFIGVCLLLLRALSSDRGIKVYFAVLVFALMGGCRDVDKHNNPQSWAVHFQGHSRGCARHD